MKRGHFYFLSFALVTIAWVLSSCGLTAKPAQIAPAQVNKYPPYQSVGYQQQKTDDERIRYILTDIQLSGDDSYYRQYADQDPVIAQAIQNWDQGDRIVNIYQFQRIDLGNDGWQVVYGGTDKIVVGSDVVLTQDIGATDNGEARIRYILADCQLGNVIDYYRQYTNDPLVAEAVNRWDQGVRVVNIDSFERKIVSDAGWKIVYSGTESMIKGMDVVLTTDQTNNVNQSGITNQCAQLNLTPEECANQGHHYYQINITATGLAPAYRPCVARQFMDNTADPTWEFPVTIRDISNFTMDMGGTSNCSISGGSNSYSYSCNAGPSQKITGSIVFSKTGVVVDEVADYNNGFLPAGSCHQTIELTLLP